MSPATKLPFFFLEKKKRKLRKKKILFILPLFLPLGDFLVTMKTSCPQKELLPLYHSEKACALDLKASGNFTKNLDATPEEISCEKFVLLPSERVLVKTGVSCVFPPNCFGSIRARSGLAMKNGIIVLAGVIDEDYRGEIGVLLFNSSKKPFEISKFDRIAQIIIQPYTRVTLEETSDLGDTSRGKGGFGSTGHK